MKKSFLILILVSCFVVGTSATIFITNYERQKAKQQVINKLKTDLPNLTPTDVLKYYWIFASQNGLDEIKLFTAKTPVSFWVQCRGEKPDEYLLEEKIVNDEEFSGTILNLRHDIRMMRANRPNLSELKILNEAVFEDEAAIDFEYLNDDNRAFFKKVDGVWKLFAIHQLDLDFARWDEYAHPRSECKKPEMNFNGSTAKEVELPEIKLKSEIP